MIRKLLWINVIFFSREINLYGNFVMEKIYLFIFLRARKILLSIKIFKNFSLKYHNNPFFLKTTTTFFEHKPVDKHPN